MTARNAMFTFLLTALVIAEAGLADPLPEGNLHVSSPPGLRVYVDNKFIGVTTAEQAGLQVPALLAGEHRVRSRRPDSSRNDSWSSFRPEPTSN